MIILNNYYYTKYINLIIYHYLLKWLVFLWLNMQGTQEKKNNSRKA